MVGFSGDARSPAVCTELTRTTHLLVSIPPDLEGDPVVRFHAEDVAMLPDLRWIGYLSTIGVYGDAAGGTVDETTPPNPTTERALRRLTAERQWRQFGKAAAKQVDIFRLPGIYGPGRSVIEALQAGTAKRIVKPGQVFNRIHIADLASIIEAAMRLASEGRSNADDTFNVVDDEPAPPQDVVTYAAELLGMPPPPEIEFWDARLSPMARSFYGECKRVANGRMKRQLGVSLAYPTYREGLVAIVEDADANCGGNAAN